MSSREELIKYRTWNVSMLAQTRDQITAAHLKRHIDNLDFQMETDPPRPQPMCGWEKSFRLHPYPCPRGNIICNAAYEEWLSIPQARRPVRATVHKIMGKDSGVSKTGG